MQEIWLLVKNYNCEKQAKQLHPIKISNTNSCFNLERDISIFPVAIIDNGTKVKINKSLLLLGEIKKIANPIKKEKIVFMQAE